VSVGAQLKSSALWTYLQGWAGTAIHFAVGIVLARLLEPSDFGVFLAVSAFTAVLIRQVQFGLPEALLQARELDRDQWSVAFWTMQGLAVLLVAVLWVLAGPLQTWYGDPRYADLMRWMGVTFLITPFSAVNGTLLRRRMQFKTLAKISVTVALFGAAVSVACALGGMGAYSFVASGIAGATLTALLMARHAPWRPSLRLRARGLAGLWQYGWRMHLKQSLNLLADKIDNMLVGRLVGIADLGLYNRAFSLARMPVSEVLGKLYQVLFSGLSRVQHDLDHARVLHQKVVCAMGSAIYPLLLVLVLVPEGLIYQVYGEKWLAAAEPLRIMALGGFATVVSATLGALSDSQGLVGREIPVQLANVLMTTAAVLIGAHWGLTGVAVGIAAKAYVLLWLMQRMLARSHVGLEWRAILEAIRPVAVAALLAAGAGLAVGGSLEGAPATSLRYLLTVGGVSTGVYAIAWWALGLALRGSVPLQANVSMVRSLVARMAGVR
jgi:O-antigen/teichoic acid export membrane protein